MNLKEGREKKYEILSHTKRMKLEEAKEILNDVVITEPSIGGYEYIEPLQINEAIQVVLEEVYLKEQELKKIKRQKDREMMEYKKEICRKDIILENMLEKIHRYSGGYFHKKKRTLMNRN